jgi:hypothetical protein
VLVANAATAGMLGRLGRRLAYLPSAGGRLADPEIVRLGRHLLFLHDHAAVPGQQLLVALTDLLGDHWVTPQSAQERQSLAALEAWIDPPAGESAYVAAACAERQPVGPVATGDEEEALYPLVEQFNRARAGRTDPAYVRRLVKPVEDFYRPLVEATWGLLWRCRNRELALPEAPSVGRRWLTDRKGYTRHIDWLNGGGLRRTRQSARQAAQTLHRLEEAGRLLEAEEACDDPLRMAPALLAHRAVRGRVLDVNRDHWERPAVRLVRRPLVTLLSPRPCLMPVGKRLWWTERPDGREFLVHAVVPSGGGAEVTLQFQTGDGDLPAVGADACFSEYTTGWSYRAVLPENEPWTHRPAATLALPGAIED